MKFHDISNAKDFDVCVSIVKDSNAQTIFFYMFFTIYICGGCVNKYFLKNKCIICYFQYIKSNNA